VPNLPTYDPIRLERVPVRDPHEEDIFPLDSDACPARDSFFEPQENTDDRLIVAGNNYLLFDRRRRQPTLCHCPTHSVPLKPRFASFLVMRGGVSRP